MKASISLAGRLAALSAVALITMVQPQPASAMDFLSRAWSSFAGGSGRQAVMLTTRYKPGTIVVSFGDRQLYFIMRNGHAISYPIGVPTGRASWSGVSYVSRKRVNPPWSPTPQMRRENPALPAYVPGGHPRNPLGVRALYLGNTLYRIHGTDAPWTIGQNVSKGCIRMYNADVADLYDRVRVGARVIVTWRRFNVYY